MTKLKKSYLKGIEYNGLLANRSCEGLLILGGRFDSYTAHIKIWAVSKSALRRTFNPGR